MSHGYKIKDQEALYFLTLQVVQWADIFTRKVYCDIVIDSMKYCQKEKNLEIYAFVIMSNHIHMIAKGGQGNLSGIIRDLKRHTSKHIFEQINATGESRRKWLLKIFNNAVNKHTRNNEYQIWTHENHPIELYSNHFINQKIEYIHNNPVKAGIVAKPEDYLFSSARNYAGLESVLDIIEVSKNCKTYL